MLVNLKAGVMRRDFKTCFSHYKKVELMRSEDHSRSRFSWTVVDEKTTLYDTLASQAKNDPELCPQSAPATA